MKRKKKKKRNPKSKCNTSINSATSVMSDTDDDTKNLRKNITYTSCNEKKSNYLQYLNKVS